LPEAPAPISALALAYALAAAGSARVSLEVLRDAALAADLSLAGSPDARARLAEAIDELVAADLASLPRGAGGWDRTVRPALPRWVAKPAAEHRAGRPPAPRTTWHAALGWAASSRWSAEEERFLGAVNAWLIAGGAARTVPLQERSLELLGEEKALGALLRGPLFAPGRLSLALLGAVRASPPFVYTQTGTGAYALVAENSATYRSLASALAGRDTPIGLVAFGGGNGFVRSVEFFAELRESGRLETPIAEIRYFGDLDAEGLRIPASASRTAAELGLPPVRPAVGLYRRLLDHGRPGSDQPVDPALAAALAAWLPAELAVRAGALLVRGQRLAQEAVGLDLLADDHAWTTRDELGVDSFGADHAAIHP
jgi:hypothetical protein